MTYYKIKKRIHSIIDLASPDDLASRIFIGSIMSLIFLNLLAVILETVPSLSNKFSTEFKIFEIFSVIVFSIEYLLRIWTCTVVKKYNHFLFGRLKFIFKPMSLIDLAAILPFFIPFFLPFIGATKLADLRFLRAIRLLRIFRVLKLGRYSTSFRVISLVIYTRKEELIMVFLVVVQLLVVISSLLYFVEKDINPNLFSSIPASLWWSLSTLMSVDYVHGMPKTAIGKFLGFMIALLRVGIFTLPAGIMASAFSEVLRKRTAKRRHQPMS